MKRGGSGKTVVQARSSTALVSARVACQSESLIPFRVSDGRMIFVLLAVSGRSRLREMLEVFADHSARCRLGIDQVGLASASA